MAEDTPQLLTAQFASNFATEAQAIRALLDKANQQDNLALQSKLLNLRRLVTGASDYLPTYDQRSYESQIKSLEEASRKAFGGDSTSGTQKPKKFAFKRAAPSAKAPPSAAPLALAQASAEATAHAKRPEPVPSSTSTVVAFSSRASEYITPKSIREQGGIDTPRDLILSDLSNCLIDLRSVSGQLNAVHLHRLVDCVVLAGWIEGSLFVEDWKGGNAVLGARQVRIHSSERVVMQLYTASLPIIESSINLIFASYPQNLSHLLPPTTSIRQSKHEHVQDFDHPIGDSPNWRLATSEELDVLERTTVVSTQELDLNKSPPMLVLKQMLSSCTSICI